MSTPVPVPPVAPLVPVKKKWQLTVREKTVEKLVDSYVYAAVGLETAYFTGIGINALSGGKTHIDWTYAGLIAAGSIAPPILRVIDAKFPALTAISNAFLALIGKKVATETPKAQA